MKRILNFIDGQFRPPCSGRYLPDVDPATGQVIAEIAESGPEDVDAAVAAASRAFESWRRTPAEERSRLLIRVAELIEENFDELARLESEDSGKPIALARRMDIPRAILNFRFFATAILHAETRAHVTDDRALNYTLRQPLGVAGLISPWNLPLYLLSWKIAPAIAAGNCCVAKPSELTPLTADRLAALIAGGGHSARRRQHRARHGAERRPRPDVASEGPAHLVHRRHEDRRGRDGPGGAALQEGVARARREEPEHRVRGRRSRAGRRHRRFTSSFSNQGEICLCGSRLFVEKTIYGEFLDRFLEGTKKLRIGDPQDASTDVGALVSEAHLRKVEGYVALAREEGGTVVVGGKRPANLPERVQGGYFLEPTVITGLDCGRRVMQEEIFGPVVTVTPFDSPEEAIALANGTRYGLSASVWTRDLQKAHRVAAALESGTVWVNTWLLRDLRVPFGGMKESGVGREGGFASLDFFTEAKNVCVKL